MNNNLIGNVGHIVTAIVVIVAAVTLALFDKITGGSALIVIAAAAGVSLGGSIASSPGSTSGTTTTTTSTATPTALPASVPPGTIFAPSSITSSPLGAQSL